MGITIGGDGLADDGLSPLYHYLLGRFYNLQNILGLPLADDDSQANRQSRPIDGRTVSYGPSRWNQESHPSCQ